jgi:hypothetical protein
MKITTKISDSYSISLDILEDQADWFWRVGLHLAFNPTDDEIDFATVDLVTDTIFAYPVKGFPPRLHLVNPLAWEPGPNPAPPSDGYRRSLTPDTHGDVWDPLGIHGGSEVLPIEVDIDAVDDGTEGEKGHMKGDAQKKDQDHNMDDLESREGDEDDEDQDPGEDEGPQSKKRKIDDSSRNSVPAPGRERGLSTSILPTPTSIFAPTPTDLSTPKDNSEYSQDPWSLTVKAKDLEKALMMSKISAIDKRLLKRSKQLLRCVAISPRGAKWVVAVGQGETTAIWKLRDKPSDS